VLFSNTPGGGNTAQGDAALSSNISGSFNTAIGLAAMSNLTSGVVNIAIGSSAGDHLTTGSRNIDIGNEGVAGESKTIRIGTQGTQTRTFIAGISVTGVMGTAVKISSSGQLGVAPSSARFKDEIKPMDKSSEAILSLKPVSFRYEQQIDPKRIPQFGLVAEEVEKVNPDLITRDADGKPFTVRYEAGNAMLLKELWKANRRIEKQDKRIDQLTAQLKEHALLIQKVNDKVELNRSGPQIVSDNQ